jgi:hypothetical protein
MKNVVRAVLLLGLIAVGIWVWTVMFPSPQKVIRNRLLKMAQLASFSAGEGNISRVAAIQRLGTYFTDEIEVVMDVPGIGTHTFNRREEVTQAAMSAKSVVNSVQADFIDIEIDLAPSKQVANANLTLRATVNGQKDFVIQELKFSLKKVNGDWLVNKIQTVKTLK